MRVIKDENNWVILEVENATANTPVNLAGNSSLTIQKLMVGAHISNTTYIGVLPTSAISAQSGVGIMMRPPGASLTPDYLIDAPLSDKGNEDLKDWWMDSSEANQRVIVVVRRDP